MATARRRKKTVPLPPFPDSVARRFPRLWEAYVALGEQTAAAGPLSERERRLVKLALAIGSGSVGATHAHARQALAEGLAAEELRHVCLLGFTTIGYPASAAALSWIDDIARS